MSVLKLILADDQNFICTELHGSRAQWVYAACSRNPKTLEELDKLLPEFGADENLRRLCSNHASFDFKPIDAGLIIVDLAKKWIYAQDSYFGAHRRGRYNPRDEEERTIEYEFSKEWQFVAEAKWFSYLHGCNLARYGQKETDAREPVLPRTIDLDRLGEMMEKETFERNFFAEMDDEESHESPNYAEEEDNEPWDEQLSSIRAVATNRHMCVWEIKPEGEAEKRDYVALEHIIDYEEEAEHARRRIELAQEQILKFKVELQAVENLWQRKQEPRWGLERIRCRAHIGKQEKYISKFEEKHETAAAMAAELRRLVATKKYREMMAGWKEDDWSASTSDYGDIPF